MPIHRSSKRELIPLLLREEWIIACLQGIYGCGLPLEEIRLLLDEFEKDIMGAVSSSQIRANGTGYAEPFSLQSALDFRFTTDDERAAWSAGEVLKSVNQPKRRNLGFVYMMKNSRNGYVKIGWSQKPKVREATLQSEEPEIELIWIQAGTTLDEERLHAKWSSKRLRGEWFSLSDEDIKEVSKFRHA